MARLHIREGETLGGGNVIHTEIFVAIKMNIC